jgi:hypothetical protein
MRRVLFVLALIAANASAATFLVPKDDDLVRGATAIIAATAGSSTSRYAPGGWIETVTEMRVEEGIKGNVHAGDVIHVTELGGEVNGVAYVVPGSPQYRPGERVLLFMETNDRGEWVSKNMALGKFSVIGDLLLRDAPSICGWDYDGTPHREPKRAADAFLRFVREVANGRPAIADYEVTTPVLPVTTNGITANAGPPVSTYLLQLSGASGTLGFRWNRFPNAVTFFSHGSQTNALNGGLTSLQRGLSAWTNDPGSTVNYQYGGTTSVSSTHLLDSNPQPDGVNSVQFNDEGKEIPGSYTGKSGDILAIGGAWAATTGPNSTHTFSGETFYTIIEADLVVQDGISGAGLTGNGFDHVITHELGHTLGLRHSDEPPPGGTSTSAAIMNSGVDFNNDALGANLQAWDREAIDAVYGVSAPPPCTPPTITTQPQSLDLGSTSVTLSVAATGDAPLQFQWYMGQSGNTSQPINGATGSAISVQPTVTTSYWVRVSNSCTPAANSQTATVTVNGCPAVFINSISDSASILQGSTVTLSANASGGTLTYDWFIGSPGDATNSAGSGSSITVHPSTTTSYWLRVRNSCGASATSGAVVVTVTPCNAPRILIQPANADVLSGTSISVSVGDIGSRPTRYQWYEGSADDISRPVPNAGTASFTTPLLLASTSYWVRVTNDCGTIDSAVANLTVVSTCRAPAIVTQPRDASVATGSIAIVSVVATGTSLSYQWYEGPLFDFTHPLAGGPATMTTAITAPTQYWVRISSPCGTLTSTVATVSVIRRRSAGH